MSTESEFLEWKSTFYTHSKPPKIKDARCYYDLDRQLYLIVYNELKPPNRIRFSLAHELAHIVLHHLDNKKTELSRGGLDDFTYWHMEGEANTFAGNFLVPPILMQERFKESVIDKISAIVSTFLISKTSALWRMQDYNDWIKLNATTEERQILIKYKLQMHPRYCSNCNYLFYSSDAKYCPICGNYRLSKKRRDNYMIYSDGIDLDKNGKAVICPKCGNEQIVEDGDYCKICGTYLVNKCADITSGQAWDDDDIVKSGCHKIVSGNARFCPYCGNPTTFANAELLKPWEEAKEEIEKRRVSSEDDKTFDKLLQTAQEAESNSNNEFREIAGDDDLPF